MKETNASKETARGSHAGGVRESGLHGLVDVLNAMPGITTTSSCGGYEHSPNPEKQSTSGEFSIDFTVDIREGGWDSLGLIIQLALRTGGEDIVISTRYTDDKWLAFTINGKNNTSPEKLARVLEIARDHQKGLYKEKWRDLFYWCG